ncbi:SGNH/GDSL hydrolase family protein [Stieleria sp. TO1_6]|uniref:SGNH/GDSL hydrolase family protein n=1 Tax=Stieleria tagensis TaxID=2956795 RepID=UPI00209AEAD4|nr:SGNH/GDSL hydrolase family protein [Stieleria tagensis]MCO8120829.1 SGNH/GDSL hydrolase family protein [Stieleria tagensis]
MSISVIFRFIVLIVLWLPIAHGQSPSVDYPAATNLGDPAQLGRGIQRTMTLLQSSNAEHRNTVRILLYGQSITAGKWGGKLGDFLSETYPHANLEFHRRPLSGFSTERLVKTSTADLYPFYADLVVFHDYGNNEDYETMIRQLREQTTAEVILQADHFRRSEQLIDESDPSTIDDQRQRWAAQRNQQFLPGLAQKYGCGFDDRRRLWQAYLQQHQLSPGDLVNDDVHPNEHGTALMTELIKAYFVARPDSQIDPMNCGYVTTHPVTDAMRSADGKLVFPFDGNRIDLVLHDQASGTCQLMIDGKPPLDDPTMFYHQRNRVKWRDTPIPPGPWPAVLKMGFEKPLVEETWTLNATQDPDHPSVYSFRVQGSVTGPDGSGRSDEPFVSDSGRVVIAAEDWDVAFSIVALRRLDALPQSFQIDWDAVAQAANQASPPDVPAGVERVVTVAQRIADQPHTLQISGEIDGIQALRVYSPRKFPRP